MSPRTLISAAAMVVASWGVAAAAPQALGLMASNGYATPLACEAGACRAQVSAFCLQESRHAPSRGTPYRPTADSEVTLVVKTADGRSLRLPGGEELSFRTLIGFTSVEVSLPRERYAALAREHGATEIAIEIGPRASLLPVEQVGDPSPQAPDEIALATGPMRQAAERTFERPGDTTDAIRITNLLINGLPSGPEAQSVAAARFWATDNAVLAAATPEGRATADWIYRSCQLAVDSRSSQSLKTCLELHHADLMATTNHRFWKEAGGS